MHNRLATPQDGDSVLALYMEAFGEEERETVANLAVQLLMEPEAFSFVTEIEGGIVGHVAFSPVVDAEAFYQGYLLAPLAVHPTFQRRGIGSKLIETGFEHLTKQNVDVVFVYGDPAFYGRFGFETDLAARFAPPYQLKYPFGWQAKLLADPQNLPAIASLICLKPLQDNNLW